MSGTNGIIRIALKYCSKVIRKEKLQKLNEI